MDARYPPIADVTRGCSDLAMDTRRETLPNDGTSLWAGMANYILVTADAKHEIELRYLGEPPHGDSFHELRADGRQVPGYVWGATFAVSPCSRYLAASWMAERYERKTAVVDLESHRFAVLPIHIADFVFRWPALEGPGIATVQKYEFDGHEAWVPF